MPDSSVCTSWSSYAPLIPHPLYRSPYHDGSVSTYSHPLSFFRRYPATGPGPQEMIGLSCMRIRNSHPGVFWSTTTFVNVRACPSGNKTRTVVLLVFIQDVPFEKTASRRVSATPAQHLHAAGVRSLGLRHLPDRPARSHEGGGLGIGGPGLHFALRRAQRRPGHTRSLRLVIFWVRIRTCQRFPLPPRPPAGAREVHAVALRPTLGLVPSSPRAGAGQAAHRPAP